MTDTGTRNACAQWLNPTCLVIIAAAGVPEQRGERQDAVRARRFLIFKWRSTRDIETGVDVGDFTGHATGKFT